MAFVRSDSPGAWVAEAAVVPREFNLELIQCNEYQDKLSPLSESFPVMKDAF